MTGRRLMGGTLVRRLSRVVVPLYLLALALAPAALGGCQRAARYPPAKKDVSPDAQAPSRPQVPAEYAWKMPIDGAPVIPDVPIEFVHQATDPAGWDRLPEFWNSQWAGAAAPLGLDPLAAVVALGAAAPHLSVKVKVPLGLPDPTPSIPPGNRPTYRQWLLGKKLFFDPKLLPGPSEHVTYACASCHHPARGFSNDRSERRLYNPPTLVNSVYNRHQFYDGRATYLEEVVQRTLDDEAGPVKGAPPEERHAWPGVVESLRSQKHYLQEFQRAYGEPPTQANLGRALAAYLRTLLSGNSVYDRAEAARARAGAKELTTAHFESALDEQSLKALASGGGTQETARELALGHALFHGKARCAVCHPAPLFTDHDFHNAGVGDSDHQIHTEPGKEKGRAGALPAGLKGPRAFGAVRTPTLRLLPRTAPYMHDGKHRSLDEVLEYFNGKIADLVVHPRWLDPELRDGPDSARRLGLNEGELRALKLFLKSLDGGPIPRVITDPPPK